MHRYSRMECPHILKHLSVFKWMLLQQVDWKRQFHSMAPKITRPNTTGLFPLGLFEEYHLSGGNCKSLNSAASHNRQLQQWPKLYLWTHGMRLNVISTWVKELMVLKLKLNRWQNIFQICATKLWDQFLCIINIFPHTYCLLCLSQVLYICNEQYRHHICMPHTRDTSYNILDTTKDNLCTQTTNHRAQCKTYTHAHHTPHSTQVTSTTHACTVYVHCIPCTHSAHYIQHCACIPYTCATGSVYTTSNTPHSHCTAYLLITHQTQPAHTWHTMHTMHTIHRPNTSHSSHYIQYTYTM